MRIIQISDIHLFADPQAGVLLGLNTAKSFEAVLALISTEEKATPPDMMILTGDLSQDETETAYRYLAQCLERFTCPIYWIPGNHDNPELMKTVFSQTRIKQDKAILLGDWQCILLNTHYPNKVEGILGRSELAHLNHYLTAHPTQHTLIFMHHHPVSINCQWLDPIGLKNTEDFYKITDQHPQIRGIIFGHVHQVFETHREGIPILSAPSTCIQFKTQSENFALDDLAPGYRWFELSPEGTFKTGVNRVKDFENTVDFSSTGY